MGSDRFGADQPGTARVGVVKIVAAHQAPLATVVAVLASIAVLVGANQMATPRGGGAERGGTVATATVATPELSAQVSLGTSKVASGGTVDVQAAITNTSSRAIQVLTDPCGSPAVLFGTVKLPYSKSVIKDWPGIAGQFKEYALDAGLGVGGVPASDPLVVPEVNATCEGIQDDTVLAPGQTLSANLKWKAELVPQLPASPQTVAITVRFAHDPTEDQPSVAPGYSGIRQSRVRTYAYLDVQTAIDVVGPDPALISADQALDVALGDARFEEWLSQEEPATWTNANLALVNRDGAATTSPIGAVWEIDLFRENGVPRSWAIAQVDPYSGQLLSLDLCGTPCDR